MSIADFRELMHRFDKRLLRIEILIGINVVASVAAIFNPFIHP